MNEIKEKQDEVVSVEKNKEQADEVLKEKKKQHTKQSRDLAELEQKIRVVVSLSIICIVICNRHSLPRVTQFYSLQLQTNFRNPK